MSTFFVDFIKKTEHNMLIFSKHPNLAVIVKKSTKSSKSGILKSAFDNQEQYELTELGSQFVHYTMQDVVTQIGN